MKLQEYQSKNLYAKYEIPIPKGRIVSTANEARQVAEELGGKVVIKAQVLVGGRGKAGGVRLAKSPEEAEDLTTQILGMQINGLPVRKVLVDEAISISNEMYLAIADDRNNEQPILIASSEGGIDIEEIARKLPDKISRANINPLTGLRNYQIRDIALSINLPRQHWRVFTDIVFALWKVYRDCDASLVEVNPLVITTEGKLIALDAKMILDDNALFRHPELADLRDIDSEENSEIIGRKFGVTFIKLTGSIGCLVNGAGLAMATMDVIKHYGEEPANFLDIGGGASAEKVTVSLRLILTDPDVKAILINVFGGITRCDEVAKGLVAAYNEVKPVVPIIVRLVGTNAEEGKRILAESPFIFADTLAGAAKVAADKVQEVER
jgi:succinyl-CoA synthetase beta subunit